MNSIQWNKWYSRRDDVNLSPKNRTDDLTQDLQYALLHGYTFSGITNNPLDSPDQNALSLINYIIRNPGMINYEFDEQKKLTKINVKPSTLFTFKHDSKVLECDMSSGITKLLQGYFKDYKYEIPVTMVNKDDCKKVEGSAEANAARAILPSGTALSESDTALHAGGRKSRRRRARKTRRRRIRKSKSKTQRRRRHSRVRKHKKNTYTRRR